MARGKLIHSKLLYPIVGEAPTLCTGANIQMSAKKCAFMVSAISHCCDNAQRKSANGAPQNLLLHFCGAAAAVLTLSKRWKRGLREASLGASTAGLSLSVTAGLVS